MEVYGLGIRLVLGLWSNDDVWAGPIRTCTNRWNGPGEKEKESSSLSLLLLLLLFPVSFFFFFRSSSSSSCSFIGLNSKQRKTHCTPPGSTCRYKEALLIKLLGTFSSSKDGRAEGSIILETWTIFVFFFFYIVLFVPLDGISSSSIWGYTHKMCVMEEIRCVVDDESRRMKMGGEGNGVWLNRIRNPATTFHRWIINEPLVCGRQEREREERERERHGHGMLNRIR